MTHPSERKRVLLLTSRTGGGHHSLAHALSDRLAESFDCAINDPQLTVVHTYYRLVSRYALWLWEAEYRLIDQPQRVRAAQQVFAGLLETPMRRAVARARPDLVISLFPYYTLAMQHAIRAARRPAAAAILLADPQNVHAGWLVIKDVDAILTPTRETERQVLDEGFARRQVHLCGWPVRAQFHRYADLPAAERAAGLAHLGLDPARFTVFLQGGGDGAAYIDRTLTALLKLGSRDPRHAVQIILATGTNRHLRSQYGQTARVYALPYTENIAHYMALADVVMGKAGPNVLMESVTLGKPFIATTYIPGQEKPNLDFIRRHGLGWVALKQAEIVALIDRLTHDPATVAAMGATVQEYRRWNDAQLATLLPSMRRLTDAVTQHSTAWG